MSERYPSGVRGVGQGFSYSSGRALAAVPVALVGGLGSGIGLGPAIAGSTAVYLLCLLALRFLPETRGKELT